MKTREQIEAMSDEERRIKTAELCGWKFKKSDIWISKRWFNPDGGPTESFPPNYLNSLDAMYGAEKTIPILDRAWFVSALMEVAGGEHFLCYHATARQRNVAFLMVML